MSYEYKSPTNFEYRQIVLTKEQHNRIFKDKIKWYNKYEYYYKSDSVRVERFYNWKLILLQTVLLPVTFLIEGLGNSKEIWTDYKQLFNQKKYGKFVSNHYWKDKPVHNEIKELIIGIKVTFK